MSTPWYSAVQDGSRIQEHIALRLFIFFEPYLVEHERMANAQLLMYESKNLGQNFFYYVFLNMKVILGLLSTPWYSIVSMKNQYNFKIKSAAKPECHQNEN